MKDMDEATPGLVTCKKCEKEVPDSTVCIYCGNILRALPPPRLTPKELSIMKYLLSLKTPANIDSILKKVPGSKESMRMLLSNLVKFGMVTRPERGRYSVSVIGREHLGGISK